MLRSKKEADAVEPYLKDLMKKSCLVDGYITYDASKLFPNYTRVDEVSKCKRTDA